MFNYEMRLKKTCIGSSILPTNGQLPTGRRRRGKGAGCDEQGAVGMFQDPRTCGACVLPRCFVKCIRRCALVLCLRCALCLTPIHLPLSFRQGVDEQLWDVFTYYTLFGNAMQPSHMKCQQFIAMCKRCGLLTGTGVTEADCDVRFLLRTSSYTRRRASALQRPRLELTARVLRCTPHHLILRPTVIGSGCFQTQSPNSLARCFACPPRTPPPLSQTRTHQQHRWSFKPKSHPPSASPRPAKCSSPTLSTVSPASLGASCRRPSPRRHLSR